MLPSARAGGDVPELDAVGAGGGERRPVGAEGRRLVQPADGERLPDVERSERVPTSQTVTSPHRAHGGQRASVRA